MTEVVRVFWPTIVADQHLDDHLGDQPESVKSLLRYANRSASRTAKMYLDAFHAIELIDLSYFASNRFPWIGSNISRTEHLDLVWHYFTGATYLYLERNKTLLNTVNEIVEPFQLGEKEPVGKRMNEIRAFLGDFIRARGTMFHEYTEMHDSVRTLSMVSLLAENDPVYVERVKWFFKDAKYELRETIGTARRRTLDDFSKLTDHLVPRLKRIVATSEALQEAYLGKTVVELEKLSRPGPEDWT